MLRTFENSPPEDVVSDLPQPLKMNINVRDIDAL